MRLTRPLLSSAFVPQIHPLGAIHHPAQLLPVHRLLQHIDPRWTNADPQRGEYLPPRWPRTPHIWRLCCLFLEIREFMSRWWCSGETSAVFPAWPLKWQQPSQDLWVSGYTEFLYSAERHRASARCCLRNEEDKIVLSDATISLFQTGASVSPPALPPPKEKLSICHPNRDLSVSNDSIR